MAVELMSKKEHFIKKGDSLEIKIEGFLYDPFHDYKIETLPKGVVQNKIDYKNNGNTNDGGGHWWDTYSLTFEQVGEFVINITELPRWNDNEILHSIKVVVT
jgi:hypothetical protein